MQQKTLYSVILSILMVAIWGCVPPKVSLMEYTMLDIDNKKVTHFMPDYAIQKRKPKIAILPPSDNTQFRGCELYSSAQEYLTQAFANTGSVELVERSQLKVLMEELKFRAGVSGDIDLQKFAKIAEKVDFVLVGSISKAYINVRFTPASSWTDKKGKTHYNPASCNEEGEIGLTLRLIQFPEGRIQKAFSMNGRAKNYRGQDNYCRVEDPCGLLNKAIEKAINNSRSEIFDVFSVYGYIYKTMTNRKNPKERIAFITLGRSDGLKEGSIVEIVEFVKERDPVKNIDIITPRIVGECTVSETDLQSDRSICIIAEDYVDKVLTGHAIKTSAPKGFWQKLR
ncbi:CsgG/HfaB family protein [Thermodesulfovibrio sp. 3462-1]|uniref:CsgG/HfaB family protein n=1 Tax=Thermodesulfovibrio obliviosus TaxID=3118332 RepID=A0AAU8H1E8_9BACT